MVQKVKSDKRPYQRERYEAFRKTGQKINSKVKDGFADYRDITTGEVVPDLALSDTGFNSSIRQFTYERRIEKVLAYAGDKDKARNGEEVQTVDFVYFVVRQINKKTNETIGRITEYTTEERLSSMIYRHYNPEHARPCSWEGMVKFSGEAPEPGKKSQAVRMPYIEIPDSVINDSGLCVDDEILITITNERGDSFTDLYHVSNMGLYGLREEGLPNGISKRRLIVPLTKFKRAVVLEDSPELPEIKEPYVRFVRGSTYKLHTALLEKGEPITFHHHYKPRPSKLEPNPQSKEVNYPCHRLINEHDRVTVIIEPQNYTITNKRYWFTRTYRPVELSVNQIREPEKKIIVTSWTKDGIETTSGDLLNPPEDGPINSGDILTGRYDFAIERLITFRIPPRE